MNEGKGDMIRIVIAYRNGSIKEKVIKEICADNDWSYKLDDEYGILIYPHI